MARRACGGAQQTWPTRPWQTTRKVSSNPLLIGRALKFPLLIQIPREAKPSVEILKYAQHLFFRAIVFGGDAANTVIEEMPLNSDVDEFLGQSQRAFEQSDHQRMRKTF